MIHEGQPGNRKPTDEYSVVEFRDFPETDDREVIVANNATGNQELFARRRGGVAGWALVIDGDQYEFVREA